MAETPKPDDIGSEIARLREARGLSLSELAQRLGVSHTLISDWETGKKRPTRQREKSLADALGADSNELRAKKGWSIRRSSSTRAAPSDLRPTGSGESEFLRAVATLIPDNLKKAIREQGLDYWKIGDRVKINGLGGDMLAAIFNTMDEHHFIAITSLTLPPSGFRPLEFPQIVRACYQAMDEGALVAFIVPNEKVVDRLTKYYHFEEVYTPNEFATYFEEWARGYEQHLQQHRSGTAKATLSPKILTGKRTQLFTWSDFPFTPYGRTISLLGESGGGGDVKFGILERNPSLAGQLGFTGQSRADHEALRRFVTCVIGFRDKEGEWKGDKHPASWLPRKGKATAEDIAAARWFAEQLRDRMWGNKAGPPRME